MTQSMTAVLPELSSATLYTVYAIMILPVLFIAGFELSERIVSRYEKRKSHTLIRPTIIIVCVIWTSFALFVSGPVANYFNLSSFHSQIEKELEVTKLVSSDGSEIDPCTKEIVDSKIFEVKWTEKKKEHEGKLTISPNGNESCVYLLTKSDSNQS